MTNSPADGDKPLVLVVDDYQDAREMYAEYLEFSGFRVAQATNGAEALDQAFALRPDIILMDLSLPIIDGWEATRRLKGDERTRSIPVVMLTAMALSVDREGLQEEGFSGVLFKPVLPLNFLADVRTRIGDPQD